VERAKAMLQTRFDQCIDDCERKEKALSLDRYAAEHGEELLDSHTRRHLVPHASWQHTRVAMMADMTTCIQDADRECVKALTMRRERVLHGENFRLKVIEGMVKSVADKEKHGANVEEKLAQAEQRLDEANEALVLLNDQHDKAVAVAESAHGRLNRRHQRPREECVEDAADHALRTEVEQATREQKRMEDRLDHVNAEMQRMEAVKAEIEKDHRNLDSRVQAEVEAHGILHKTFAAPEDSLQSFRRPRARVAALNTGLEVRAPCEGFSGQDRRMPRLSRFNALTPRTSQSVPNSFWTPPYPRSPQTARSARRKRPSLLDQQFNPDSTRTRQASTPQPMTPVLPGTSLSAQEAEWLEPLGQAPIPQTSR